MTALLGSKDWDPKYDAVAFPERREGASDSENRLLQGSQAGSQEQTLEYEH
jgi:hypothetical protein